ncbi:BREX protein BrxB domain-containing protein [Thalassolituus sp.]|jgi:hypothetical protein|uniref:BREX protein BrxB domain-containing protein n=1 Tax=Thalassolituus sp. TaxID=2030822 RepID=UPI0027D495E7|nr:BREX protein BrxB domain-containing protein [Thalassolituus sp.]MDQ4425342.1 DUF1788 domain-containing protein [Thalassolituus sp.]
MTYEKNLATAPINVRFDHVLAVMSGERFLHMKGLGNEVPFFICPYVPEETVEIAKMQNQLVSKLEEKGVRVLTINLYDLSIQILKAEGIWERVLEVEPEESKEDFKELLQSVLDPESNLVPAIAEKMTQAEYDVMMITGVGEVFPYIRSHNVLNNLQRCAKEKPTVMFFPGGYTHSLESGASLELFSRLRDDKYYRAFNIYHCEA